MYRTLLVSVLVFISSTPRAFSSSTAQRSPSGVVAALLAEGRVALFDVATGALLLQHPGPNDPRPLTLSQGRLVQSTSGGEVFASLSLPDGSALIAVSPRPPAARIVSRLFTDQHPALTIARDTGWVYALASGSLVTQAIDPRTGADRGRMNAPPRDADVYDAAITADGQRLYVSYHGNTDGIVRFDATDGGWRRTATMANHGSFRLAGGRVLAATGSQEILEYDEAGTLLRTLSTGLAGNHLMEFTLDEPRRMIYAVGSCGYAQGFSATPWPATGTGEPRLLSPLGDYSICGERISVSADGAWVAVGMVGASGSALRLATRRGVILILDTATGGVRQRIETTSDVVDVLAVR